METDRRPLKTRERKWAKALARKLVDARVTPNHISLASIVAALSAFLCFFYAGETFRFSFLMLLAAVFVQIRLLCNMLDGMVAIEGGQQTRSGAFFNEFPDRISDILILLGFALAAGHSFYSLFIGTISVSLALLTAYVRALGASLIGEQDFRGPMAKPHRMALVTIASALTLWPAIEGWNRVVIISANWILIFGTAFTVYRRSRHLLDKLGQT